MKIRLYLIILILTLNSITTYSQNSLKYAPYTRFVTNNNSHTFLISTRPITNREYIIYLQWLVLVYCDYPDVFIEAFPGSNNYMLFEYKWDLYKEDTAMRKYFKEIGGYSNLNYYQFCIERTPSYVRNYIFNPKYIDYPIIGITWLQASKYCKWLSDRYNENTLIKKNYLEEDFEQRNENCFVTESYLNGQFSGSYSGDLRYYKRIQWENSYMVPVFRLPTKDELSFCIEKGIIEQNTKPYPYLKDFLQRWNRTYLETDQKSVFLKIDDFGKSKNKMIIQLPWINYNTDSIAYNELTLDNNTGINHKSLLEIFDDNGQHLIKWLITNYKEEKDSFGNLSFIIIEENTNKEPIMVANYKNIKAPFTDTTRFYIFRFACTMKPKQYVP